MELSSGETPVWIGRPSSVRRDVIRSIPKGLGGFFILILILFWICGIVGDGDGWHHGWNAPPFTPYNVGLAIVASVWMIPGAIFLLTWPLRTWWRLNRTEYILTDRRAIISESRLFGPTKVREYSADSLRLMRVEEHTDGTGDVVFEHASTWVVISETVGFLAQRDAWEVENLIRRTLPSVRQEPSQPKGSYSRGTISTRTYRLPFPQRAFLAFFIAAALLCASLIIIRLVALGMTSDLAPKPGSENRPAELTIALAVFVLGSRRLLMTPVEIAIDSEGSISLRSWLHFESIPIQEIFSIQTGGWIDPNRHNVIIRHKRGRATLSNDFPRFQDCLATIQSINPNIKIKNF